MEIKKSILKAIKENNAAEIKKLLEKRPKMKVGKFLYQASNYDNAVVLEVILDRCPSINKRFNYGWTVLHRSCMYGRYNNVVLLLKKGASLELKDNTGWTPLHHASAHGHDSIVQLLLTNGAKVDALDNECNTALHHAVKHQYKDIISILLKNNANMTITNLKEETPYSLANEEIKLLLQPKIVTICGPCGPCGPVDSCDRKEEDEIFDPRGSSVQETNPLTEEEKSDLECFRKAKALGGKIMILFPLNEKTIEIFS